MTERGAHLDGLTRPMPVAALALLLVNDHVLKPNHPGWLSGKLSDVAVMALLPFLILAVSDAAGVLHRRLPVPGRTATTLSVVGSVLLFIAIELVAPVGHLYQWGLGAAQWPAHALASAIGGQGLPTIRPVTLTHDPSDLLTLPAVLAIIVTRRRWRSIDPARRPREQATTKLATPGEQGPRGIRPSSARSPSRSP